MSDHEVTDESQPSVRIEYDAGLNASPEAPRAPTTPRRTGVMVVVAAIGLGGAALLWADGPQEPAPPAEQANQVDDSNEDATPLRILTNDEIDQTPMGDFIFSAVASGDGGWLALRRGQRGSRLVSASDGVKWSPVGGEAPVGNLFGLTRTTDGVWRTLVNSAALNEQRFTLSALRSTDGVEWLAVEGGEQFIASGNLPKQVSLRGENTVVVGDQPLDIDSPPAALTALLEQYVSPEIASNACELAFVRSGSNQRFDLRSCDGDVLGSISDDDRQRMNTLSTVAFVMQFQQVVLVQIGAAATERVILDPGEQIVSIAATDDGFVGIAIDALAAVDTANVRIGTPPGRLVRWTRAGGLADVTGSLGPIVDFTAWWDNDLIVDAQGVASMATSSAVYRAPDPYTEWSEVARAPITNVHSSAILRLGPEGSAMVFRNRNAQIWLGRVGGEWVRAPQLDGSVPRNVLLADENEVVAAFEFDSFVLRLVRVQLTAPDRIAADNVRADEVDPHRITSIAPVGESWVAATRDRGSPLWSTDGGLTWATSGAPGEPTELLAVGQDSDGVTRALVSRPDNEGGTTIETQVVRTDGWIHDAERSVFPELQGRIVRGMVGDTSVVLVEEPWDQPVPVVSDALADFVSRSMADETCVVTRTIVEGTSVYELADCSGRLLETIGKDLIDIGSEADDRLAFAQEVLRKRILVHLARPGGEVSVVEMGPSQIVLGLVPTQDGFLALILDSSDVLGDTNLLYSQALAARIVHWDRATGLFRTVETPVRASAWSGNRVVGNDDGSITLVSSLGLYRSDPPFTDWTLLTTGPDGERLAPFEVFSSALFGDGFFVDDGPEDDRFWAWGGQDVGWRHIETGGFDLRRVLLSSSTRIVFDTIDGQIVEVSR